MVSHSPPDCRLDCISKHDYGDSIGPGLASCTEYVDSSNDFIDSEITVKNGRFSVNTLMSFLYYNPNVNRN